MRVRGTPVVRIGEAIRFLSTLLPGIHQGKKQPSEGVRKRSGGAALPPDSADPKSEAKTSAADGRCNTELFHSFRHGQPHLGLALSILRSNPTEGSAVWGPERKTSPLAAGSGNGH